MGRHVRHGCRLLWFLGIFQGIQAAAALGGDTGNWTVAKVQDDGAVVLRLGGREALVRLLGVTIDRPTDPLRRLLEGSASPVLQPGSAVDSAGTPLVELFRGGRSLNELAIRGGLARVDERCAVAPRLLERLHVAQREARENGRGLWAAPTEVPRVEVPRVEERRPPEPTPPAPEPEEDKAEAGPEAPTPSDEEVSEGPVARQEDTAVSESAIAWPWAIARPLVGLPSLGLFQDGLSLGLLHAFLATLGCWVARQKGRWGWEGLVIGGLFGPLGVMVEALLPARLAEPRPLSTEEDADVTQHAGSSPNAPAVSPLARYVAEMASNANSGSASSPMVQVRPTGLKSEDMAIPELAAWEQYEELPADNSFMRDDEDLSTASGTGPSGSDGSVSSTPSRAHGSALSLKTAAR